jgi:hypothetical protein
MLVWSATHLKCAGAVICSAHRGWLTVNHDIKIAQYQCDDPLSTLSINTQLG